MFSCFMDWMICSLGGISPCEEAPGFEVVQINPYLPAGMRFIEVKRYTDRGCITVHIERDENGIVKTDIDLPEGVESL